MIAIGKLKSEVLPDFMFEAVRIRWLGTYFRAPVEGLGLLIGWRSVRNWEGVEFIPNQFRRKKRKTKMENIEHPTSNEKKNKTHAIPRLASIDGLGVNRVGNTILCYAWGETDRPDVCLARTADDVRRFLIREIFGDDKDPALHEWMQEIAEHDWREDGELKWNFEIGGVRFGDVFDATPKKN